MTVPSLSTGVAIMKNGVPIVTVLAPPPTAKDWRVTEGGELMEGERLMSTGVGLVAVGAGKIVWLPLLSRAMT